MFVWLVLQFQRLFNKKVLLPQIIVGFMIPSKFTKVRRETQGFEDQTLEQGKKIRKWRADFKRRLSSDSDRFQGEITTFVKSAHFKIFSERLKF